MKETHAVIALLFLVTVCLNGVICSSDFVLFHWMTDLNGYTCPVKHSEVISNISNRITCLHLCMEAPSCQGVFIELDTLKCIKCSVETFGTAPAASNTIFYKRQAESVGEEVVPEDFTYVVVGEKLSWIDAKNNCEQLGGYLTSITSSEEQTYIVTVVMADHSWGAWIGGSRTAGDASSFKWVDGTYVAAGYVNWDVTRPVDDHEENCVKLSKGANYQWITLDCEILSYSICKFE